MAGAGALDRLIVIQRNEGNTKDAHGALTAQWVELAKVWASRKDLSDTERMSADQVNSTLMSRFRVRSSIVANTINSKDRIFYDGKFWDIHGAKEAKEGRKRYIEITAECQSD